MSDAAPPYRVHVNRAGPNVPADLLARAVEATLRSEGVDEAEVSVTLLPDDEMAELNRRYLDRDGTTDVISFCLGEEGAPPLGDVYVGVEQGRRQAYELGVPDVEELVRLVVHGTLHLLGHDHPEGPERTRSPMFRRQESLVRTLVEAG